MPEPTGFRVLIVDDSPTMRAVCTQSLSGAGMRCRSAGSGAEGLALLLAAADAGAPFDGLLLDWLMPGMNGWEVLEQIHAERRLDHLAVMIFTEQPDDRAYQLASRRPNNDIQLKEDLTLLPYRMRKFLTTYSEAGGMGDWRARQLLRTRDSLGGSILFVDDSPTVCAKYSDLLRNNGYTVLIAHSMAQALEVAQRDKPQLAVVDYFMPNGNGDELCRALLGDDRTRDITVVMHSQRKEVIEDALDAGAIDLIWKDDPINIFLMRVASIMRTLRANRQARDLDILFAAHPAEALLDQHAQDPALALARHVADVVQIEGAVVGPLEHTDLARPAVVALLAEQFDIQPFWGHAGSGDGDELGPRPGAGVMDLARDQLLARSRRAGDQDAAVGRGDIGDVGAQNLGRR
jgi:CheY-like chemotaxis protein